MIQETITKRKSWRLSELPPVTGLTLAFWRKVVRQKKIRYRKVEGAVIILDADLDAFLAGEPAKEEPASAGADAK